jgi:hypothetical protein
VQYGQGFFSNHVNSGAIHGVRLEQADGLGNLDVDFNTGQANRGDAGDPFPGSSNNTVFGTTGNPTARLNAGGVAAGFVIDSIRQTGVGVEMAFRLRFGFPVTFSTTGPGTIAATPAIASGSFINAGDSVKLVASASGAVPFVGWSGDTTTSNATLVLHATRAWNVVAGFASPIVVSDTVLSVAVMGSLYADQLIVTGGSGTYTFSLFSGQLPTGLSLASNGVISGIASADSTWNFTVRVTSGPQTLDLPLRMHTTEPALAVSAIVAQLLGGPSSLSTSDVTYLDLVGNHNNTLDIGDLVAWLDRTGNAVSSATMQRLMTRRTR